MSFPITVPSVGESITSAVISSWHVANGAQVKAGDLLVTVDTDKVSTEITAEASGTVTIAAQPGEEVKIGAVIGTIGEGTGAAAPPSGAPAPTRAEAAPPPPAKQEEKTVPSAGTPADAPSPAAAASQGAMPFTGEKPAPKIDLSVTPAKPAAAAPVVRDQSGRTTRQRMSPLRKKIATHLVNAQQTAAILTTFNEVDMTEVMNLRKLLQDGFVARHGVKLGFMSFFIKAVVEALKTVPAVNGRIDGDDIVTNHFYDIGVAIGTERGLIVPVLRDADQKSFADLEKEIIAYATRAKEGKINMEDLQGGVFTISNGGVYGSLLSTPILNPPQSAILGMHTIQQRPVAINGQVVIRPMMYLALSYDHRQIDGKEAVTFLLRIKDCIEQPSRLLLGA
jgi:2-oxoglutarate dehydrogenase E2 component (dihydrolipoamide succinyltransferase)